MVITGIMMEVTFLIRGTESFSAAAISKQRARSSRNSFPQNVQYLLPFSRWDWHMGQSVRSAPQNGQYFEPSALLSSHLSQVMFTPEGKPRLWRARLR